MIVLGLFILLAVVALAGAAGVLICRQATHCVFAFLLCCLALGGLYLLLNVQVLAVLQLATSVFLAGTMAAVGIPAAREATHADRRPPLHARAARASIRRALSWPAWAGLLFLALVAWVLAHATTGEPVFSSPPIWAVPGGQAAALGQELATRYLIVFALLGLLLLAGLASIGYLIQQSQRSTEGGNK
jgi:NADH:ubiquinone oxidoreductase subunit 6 (subunit J)